MKENKFLKFIRKILQALSPKTLIQKWKASKMGQSYQKLCEKLKPMTWAQRIDFFWTYYKDIVVFAGVLAIIPISIVVSFVNKKDALLGGKFINLDLRKAGYEYLVDDLFEHMDGNPKTHEIQIGCIAFEEYSTQPEYNYNVAMSVFGAIDGDVLDFMFTDQYAMEFYLGDLIYMDLNLIFSKDELAEMEDMLIYLQDDTTLVKTPVAINVTNLDFVQDCVYDEEEVPVFLVFVGPFEEAEQYHDFWEYLLAWEGVPEEN